MADTFKSTSHKTLYGCTEVGCRVVMFAGPNPTGGQDICPACGSIGLVIRGPIDEALANHTDQVRRRLEEERKERTGEASTAAEG